MQNAKLTISNAKWEHEFHELGEKIKPQKDTEYAKYQCKMGTRITNNNHKRHKI